MRKLHKYFKFERVDEECDDITLKLIAEKTNSEVCHVNLTGESLFDDSSSTFYLFWI